MYTKMAMDIQELVQTLATWLSSLNHSYIRSAVTVAYTVNKFLHLIYFLFVQ